MTASNNRDNLIPADLKIQADHITRAYATPSVGTSNANGGVDKPHHREVTTRFRIGMSPNTMRANQLCKNNAVVGHKPEHLNFFVRDPNDKNKVLGRPDRVVTLGLKCPGYTNPLPYPVGVMIYELVENPKTKARERVAYCGGTFVDGKEYAFVMEPNHTEHFALPMPLMQRTGLSSYDFVPIDGKTNMDDDKISDKKAINVFKEMNLVHLDPSSHFVNFMRNNDKVLGFDEKASTVQAFGKSWIQLPYESEVDSKNKAFSYMDINRAIEKAQPPLRYNDLERFRVEYVPLTPNNRWADDGISNANKSMSYTTPAHESMLPLLDAYCSATNLSHADVIEDKFFAPAIHLEHKYVPC